MSATAGAGRTFVYYRPSFGFAATESSVNAQIDDCERLANALGLVVEEVYADRDPWPGPALQRMLNDIEADVGISIVVSSETSLVPDVLDLPEKLDDLEYQLCASVHICDGPLSLAGDLLTESGRAFLAIYLLGRQAERDAASERTLAGLRAPGPATSDVVEVLAAMRAEQMTGDGIPDLTTPGGRFLAEQMAEIWERDSTQRSERIKLGLKARKQRLESAKNYL